MEIGQLSQFISSPQWDIVLIFVFIVLSFLFTFLLGRGYLLALIFSTYITLVLYPVLNSFIPQFSSPGISQNYINIAIFLTIVTGVTILIGTFIFPRSSSIQTSWPQTYVLGFIAIGLLMSVVLRFLSSEELQLFSGLGNKLFFSDIAYTVWILLPLVGFLLIKRTGE